MKLRQGPRSIEDVFGIYSSPIQGRHEEASGGGTTFRDFLNLPGHTSWSLGQRFEQRRRHTPWAGMLGRRLTKALELALDRQVRPPWREWLMLSNPIQCATSSRGGPLIQCATSGRGGPLIQV
eukprot:352175-Chlamydomonas_euryale.AAC.2